LRFPRSLARVCKGFQIKNASVPARQKKKWEMLINCRVHAALFLSASPCFPHRDSRIANQDSETKVQLRILNYSPDDEILTFVATNYVPGCSE
jgi:hypothetical protein